MENSIEFVTDTDHPDRFSLRFPAMFTEHLTVLMKLRTITGIRIPDRYMDVCPPYFYLDPMINPQDMFEPVKRAIQECFGDKYIVSPDGIDHEASWCRFRKRMRKKGYNF